MDYVSLLRFKKLIGISIFFNIAALIREFGDVFQPASYVSGRACRWFCGEISVYILIFLVILYAGVSLYTLVHKPKIDPVITEPTIKHIQGDKKTNSFGKVVFITLYVCFFLIALGGVYSFTHEINIGVLVVSAVIGGAAAIVFYLPMLWLL